MNRDGQKIESAPGQWRASWQSGEPVPNWVLWLAGLFLLLGLGLMGAGLWRWQQQQAFAAQAASAAGTVVDLAPRRSSQGNTLYAPVVRFADGRGTVHQFRTSAASNPPAYRRGETVTVLYDPHNPEIAMMADWRSHITSGILATLGLLFALFGSFFLLHLVRARRQERQPMPAAAQRLSGFYPSTGFS